MSTLKTAVISLAFAAAFIAPAVALADTTPWWCNTPFGNWWGVQNCQAPSNGAGGLLVYVSVANSVGQTLGPSDFTVNVSGPSANPASFAGSINGSPVVVYPGNYSVALQDTRGYDATYSTGCSGALIGGQYALCVITLSNSSSLYPYATPYAGAYYYQPLVCSATYPTVSLGNLGRFVATGGKGTYNWATASGSNLNTGSILNTSFMSTGVQTVVVTSGSEVATCSVNVVSQPGYGSAPGSYVSTVGSVTPTYYTASSYSNGSYSYSNPGVTVVTNSYPTLPNTGFEPQNDAAFAFAVVLLLGSAIAVYPHARKAFTVVTR